MVIKKYAILGERCSGTNYLDNIIKTNFNLELNNKYINKHFFCFNNYNDSEDTLFIGIIRNPIYWINSFYKEQHHVPKCNGKDLNSFLNNKFYSISDDNKLILKDTNYVTKNIYNDIFEMRKWKNFYLINCMIKKVKNYILINYESLLYNFNYTMDFIVNKYNLVTKFDIYKNSKKYKKSDTYNFVKQREILLLAKEIEYIWNRLFLLQEERLGYYKDDNNNNFKNQDNIKFIYIRSNNGGND
jgi:hypothetical protein